MKVPGIVDLSLLLIGLVCASASALLVVYRKALEERYLSVERRRGPIRDLIRSKVLPRAGMVRLKVLDVALTMGVLALCMFASVVLDLFHFW